MLHEPATVVTDYLLALVAAGLAVRLRRQTADANRAARGWSAALALTALSACVGGTHHGIAPELPAGLVRPFWTLTLFSVCAVSAAMDFSLAHLHLLSPPRRQQCGRIAAIKVAAFALATIVQPQFVIAIVAYGTSLVAWTVAALALRPPWRAPLFTGVGLSVLAATVQQAHLSPSAHFNHNDLYHVMQALALIAFYHTAKQLQPEPSAAVAVASV
jgi:hypothetical protein